ncbi:MAG: gliding motility-associated C-terminal domain-containing protein [Cytophagaceae bacterium]|nr:gliding motility-associated C-terminal domain-containing protein [Cytophagaceae bacterium]
MVNKIVVLLMNSLPGLNNKVRCLLGCLYLALLHQGLWAQTCFMVDRYEGCAPFTVTITDCSSLPPIIYNYDYARNPNNFVSNSTFTYNTPGTYQIVQRVQGNPNTITSLPVTIRVNSKHTPLFDVSACAGQQVRLAITDTLYDLFEVNYGDGSATQTLTAGNHLHSYTDLSTRTVSVKGFYSDGCEGASGSKQVSPITTLQAPDLIDFAVNIQATSGHVSFSYHTLKDRYYQILRKVNNGVFVPLDTIYSQNNGTTVSGFQGGQNTFSGLLTYRINNIDMCNNSESPGVDLNNIIINVSSVNGQNIIDWKTNGNFSSFTIERSAGIIATNATSPFIDYDISCNLFAVYKVTGIYPVNNTTSGLPVKSHSTSVTTNSIFITTLPAVKINSGYENGNVVVRWDLPADEVDTYTLLTSGSNNGVKTLGGSSINYVTREEGICYQLSYSDPCGNNSLISNSTCPTSLTLVKNNEAVDLSWSPYTGYSASGLSHYELEVLNEDGSLRTSYPMGLATSYSEILDPAYSYFTYRVKAVPNGSENMISYSNVATVDLTPKLTMPNTFTPNGDGINDVLLAKGKYIANSSIQIFNKWGEVIYVSEDATDKGWDGTFQGSPVPTDTYSYLVKATSNKGESIQKRGVVSVVR